jgi:hypothetical protein
VARPVAPKVDRARGIPGRRGGEDRLGEAATGGGEEGEQEPKRGS